MWFGKTFKEVADDVLAQQKLNSAATYSSADRQINRLISYFGTKRIQKISERCWNDYVLVETTKKPRKFYDDKKFMRMILLYGVRQGYLEKQVRLSIPGLSKNAGREVTAEELRTLLARANPQLAFQIRIAYKMGLRLREMLFLRWDRIDWNNRTIRLLKEDTKTRRGRDVPIAEDLFSQFEALYQLSNSPYVFPHRFDVTRPQHDNKSAWIRLKRRCGIRCRWHDLRHTCATLLIRKGVSTRVASKYLGMSPRVLDIYEHLNTDDLRAAASAMSEAH